MKVIKPLEISSSNLVYTNLVDVVPNWNSSTTYSQSTSYSRVLVLHNNNYYESLSPNNLNHEPPDTVSEPFYWRLLGTFSDFNYAEDYWNENTTYSIGDIVFYQNKNYESLRDSNSNKNPLTNLSGTSPYWLEDTSSNIIAQFDMEASTQSIGGDISVTTVNTPKINSAALFNVEGDKVYLTSKRYPNAVSSLAWKIKEGLQNTVSSTLAATSIYFSPKHNILLAGIANTPSLVYSYDFGNTWSSCNISNTQGLSVNIKDITYSKELNKFVAVGSGTVTFPYPVILTSTNGKDWTQVYSATTHVTNLTSVTYIAGLINKFICTGNNGRILYSSDGNIWSPATAISGSVTLNDSVYNSNTGEVFVVGTSGTIRKSSDLITWSSVTSNTSSIIYSIEYSGEYYVAVGANSVLLTSQDGTNWADRSSIITVGIGVATNLRGVEYCPAENCFVIVTGSDIANIIKVEAFSSNSWSAISVGFGTSTFNYIYYSQIHDSLLLVGNNSAFITSNIIYYSYKDLNTTLISNWYEYFFKEDDNLTELVFENIPVYTTTTTTVGIYDSTKTKVGVNVLGNIYSLGVTQYGAGAGIIDYSKKETDEFGNTTFTRRAFSKRMNVNIIFPSGDLKRIQKLLSEIRATPCVWVGTNDSTYSPLVMYGFYRDFNLEIPYPEYSYCSLQVEGLI
jgi:hypothetical protein